MNRSVENFQTARATPFFYRNICGLCDDNYDILIDQHSIIKILLKCGSKYANCWQNILRSEDSANRGVSQRRLKLSKSAARGSRFSVDLLFANSNVPIIFRPVGVIRRTLNDVAAKQGISVLNNRGRIKKIYKNYGFGKTFLSISSDLKMIPYRASKDREKYLPKAEKIILNLKKKIKSLEQKNKYCYMYAHAGAAPLDYYVNHSYLPKQVLIGFLTANNMFQICADKDTEKFLKENNLWKGGEK